MNFRIVAFYRTASGAWRLAAAELGKRIVWLEMPAVFLLLVSLAGCITIRPPADSLLVVPDQVFADWAKHKGSDSYDLVLESASAYYKDRTLTGLPVGEGALGFPGVPNLIDRLCYGQPGLCGVTGGLEGGLGWFGPWDGPLPANDDRASGRPNPAFRWGRYRAMLIRGKVWTLARISR